MQFLQMIFILNFFRTIFPLKKDTYANEVKKFADLLKPYVRMDKINALKEELRIN
jgi:hypothetical protein